MKAVEAGMPRLVGEHVLHAQMVDASDDVAVIIDPKHHRAIIALRGAM